MPPLILLQVDSDPHASSFDSVVAIDAGVDRLLTYDHVDADGITNLVHGAMFTRGGDQLRCTAIFFGGSDVATAEELFSKAQEAFFGPVRVSLMLDANGCNTTAAAAVVTAAKHQELEAAKAVVLGGTGPVGQRVGLLLAKEGADVTLTSRSKDRAASVCRSIEARLSGQSLTPASTENGDDLGRCLDGAAVVISAGAAGIELVSEARLKSLDSLRVAIDLNAVPPSGIGGVGVTDKAVEFGNGVAYGAIGVGGLKMRTHKAAIKSLFESNDRVLDAKAIFDIAQSLD